MQASGKPELLCSFEKGAGFLSAFRPGPPLCFLVPASGGLLSGGPALGERVKVRVRFQDRNFEVRVACHVVDLVRAGKEPGWLVGLEEGQESRRDLLLACAHGESLPISRRRHPRFPVALAASMRAASGIRTKVRVANVGEGGLGLACPGAELQGSEVEIRLRRPGTLLAWPLKVRGRVAFCEADDGEGFNLGICLTFASEREQRTWQELVAAAARGG